MNIYKTNTSYPLDSFSLNLYLTGSYFGSLANLTWQHGKISHIAESYFVHSQNKISSLQDRGSPFIQTNATSLKFTMKNINIKYKLFFFLLLWL